jgi:hypothetical protein
MQKPTAGKKSSKQLAKSINEVSAQSQPAREEYYRNLQSALAGRGQDIPAAQAAYKDVLASAQTGTAQTAKDLRASGVESRFASPILDKMQMEGGRSADDARQQIMNAFLGQAPSSILGSTAQGQQGLLSSAQRYNQLFGAAQASNTQVGAAGAGAAAAILAAFL